MLGIFPTASAPASSIPEELFSFFAQPSLRRYYSGIKSAIYIAITRTYSYVTPPRTGT